MPKPKKCGGGVSALSDKLCGTMPRKIDMNNHCDNLKCKHLSYCKLSKFNTEKCKIDTPKDDLILNRTWQEIKSTQSKKPFS